MPHEATPHGPPPRDAERPIPVVLFCGRFMEPAARRFLVRLAEHPGIELAGVFAQGQGQAERGRLAELWRRRGLLALPIAARDAATALARRLSGGRAGAEAERAHERRIDVVPDLHDPAFIEQIRRLAPDLGLVYGGPILRPELFNLPRLGTLGIHHGRLPAYRGKKTTFWQLYRGETRAYVTIQRVNEGIDTGDVVVEGSVAAAGKSYGRVDEEVQALGVELFLQAILAVKEGTATFRRPVGPRGKLYRDPTAAQLLALPVRRWLARRRS